MGMDKKQASAMLDEIHRLMQESYPDFEITMKTKRYSSQGQVSFKMEVTEKSVKADMDSDAQFRGMIKNGVNPNCIGLEFKLGDDIFIVEDVSNRKMKYPVFARQVRDGKLYKFTASSINARMIS